VYTLVERTEGIKNLGNFGKNKNESTTGQYKSAGMKVLYLVYGFQSNISAN
jgi:hypothetical protein